MAKGGGPVMGVQIENEYSKTGAGKGEEHIAKLIELARKHGFDVPFFSVTGWHNAPFPKDECLPMFNGYPAAPWNWGCKKLSPRRVYRFDLQRTAEGTYLPETDTRCDLSPYPLMFCEVAVGNQVTGHRRPLVNALDGVVAAFTRLGVGASGLGYYMYHGGTNPDGKFVTLQESKATGYPNDCPVKSYDFQAPIRESGRIDEKYHYLKQIHLFMHDYAGVLAPAISLPPDRVPKTDEDFGPARMALRTDGETGFLFVNNHVRGYPQPDRKDVQIAVKMAMREILIPETPVTVPADSFFVWPVALPMNGALLLYSTAQPLCVLENGEEKTYLFAQTVTDRPEYVFDSRTIRDANSRFVVRPGFDSLLSFETITGRKVRILTLTKKQALHAYKLNHHEKEYLVVCDANLIFADSGIGVHAVGTDPISLDAFPSLDFEGTGVLTKEAREQFSSYSILPHVTQLNDPIVQQVEELRWNVKISAIPPRSLLEMNYMGDAAKLYLGDRLVADNFYNGEPFEINLDHLPVENSKLELILEIIPLSDSKKIYFDVPRPGKVSLDSVDVSCVGYEVLRIRNDH